ncbi:diguanylate cyclase domain-containing protein [Ferrovum myxofaciens]|nr:diguanylate cyclase [Ferrovum myxofaciens]
MMKQKTRILVVDDDAHLRKTLADILRVKGYETVVAANGAEAIAAAKHETFSLLLIDLMLPDMSGLEVMARIKAIAPLTEAIILTGHASMDTAIKATGQGAFSYVLKPYQMDDLLQKIKHGTEHQLAQEEILRLASFPRLHPSPVIEINLLGEVTYANPAAEKLFPDLISQGVSHPLLNGLSGFNERRSCMQLTDVFHEVEIGTGSGQATYEVHTYCIPGLDLIRIYAMDITQRKQAQADLRIASIVFESQEGITITDSKMAILRVNPTFTKITGYSDEEAIGNNPRLLKSGRHDAQFYAVMWESINRTGSWEGEIWNRRKSGEIYPEYIRITAVKDNDGVVTNYVGTFNDITTSKLASDEIKNLAFYDPLTHLPNRRLLMDRFRQALASSARSGRGGALLFIDLDNFKNLNDTLGHDIGDLLLQQVALRLESCVRECDTVARLGGDEFVVMLEELSEHDVEAAEQTESVGSKIIAELNRSYQLATHTYHSTPSIGATIFSDHAESQDELLKQADIAMYQSKQAGRNTMRFFNPKMQEIINVRAALESELLRAFENRQFHMYYQSGVSSLIR